MDEPACKRSCSDDCNCDAYGVISNKCLLLNSEMLNNISNFFVSEDSSSLTFPFNIKVSSSDLPNIGAKRNTKVLVAGIVSGFCVLLLLGSIGIVFYRRAKRKGSRDLNQENLRHLVDPGILSAEDRKGIDVPFIEFKTILSATDNFSLANKLGQGGFGPVYKGMLRGVGEVAVKRVVGTYGYMSPEYVLDGLFSVKSDVFSFGVVVLEIISGKRNTGYYHNQQALSLISYAWGLWKAKTPLDLVDLALAGSCNSIEVLRCMIVGLLCVQEDPGDRPTMVNVVLMLGMDIESLPDPKEPAFVSRKRISRLPSSPGKSEITPLTISEEEGR
ncbi:hypothetical protein L2E82_42605 [Cichorium intybus]|uniref:Uncharacterized protein n=1 Tax=Cichorium intybus TaxID=13427 RepID=A0ACB8ZLC1_CICIN|nr:hypothetical protein L2E82_42605 [Cichorium intybus]